MKLTVILRSNGTLVGTAQHMSEGSDIQATLRPMVGHTLHEIEMPDECRDLAPDDLHERIRKEHLRGHCR